MRLHPARAVGLLRAPWIPGWSKDPLWRRARAVPSLDLRFADNKSLVDATTGANLVTFSRASGGTYIDSQGVIQTAVVDEPRFDHNPSTGESLGLLVEELRKNEIRNNTMVGAVAGTPGTLPTNWNTTNTVGVTTSVLGTGTEKGINYIDIQASGIPTGNGKVFINFDTSTSAVASSGQAWTNSVYLAIPGGSLDNITSPVNRLVERTAAGAYVDESNSSWASLSNTTLDPAVRNVVTRSSLGATAQYVNSGLSFNVTSGAAIDITLRIGMPQLEQGTFATSVIPTSGTAATRAADVASITGTNFSSWYRQDEGTVFAEVTTAPSLADTRYVLDISSGSFSDGIFITKQLNAQATARSRVSNADSFINTGDGAAWVGNEGSRRIALALSASSGRFATQGALRGADQTGLTMPVVNSLKIAALSGNAFILNGTIRRLTYWPVRLENTVLQQITQ